MENNFTYEVHPKETTYFIFKIIAAVVGYFLIISSFFAVLSSPNPAAFFPLILYAFFIGLYLFFRFGILIGYIKGNAVKITKKQFPQIHDLVLNQCKKLQLSSVPDVYVLQSGGVLNAFATRFLGSNYVVIYSEILEEAFEGNMDTVEFVIGHELGHLKRKHITKSLLLFPSFFVPFLNSAYSRACEYTCDNIGHKLSPNGVKQGLLLLASGKKLWNKINSEAFIEQELTEYGFWFWFSEKVSTHPRLTKRLSRFKTIEIKQKTVVESPKIVHKETTDHSSFLPKH